MTKKDFILISEVLKGLFDDGAHALDNENDCWAVAERFAKELAKQNPRFDKARFMKACGVANG